MRSRLHWYGWLCGALLFLVPGLGWADVFPGQSIQDAVDQAGGGGTTTVHAGTYAQVVHLSSGSSGSRTTLRSAGDGEVILRPSDINQDCIICIPANGQWIVVDGFTLDGGDSGGTRLTNTPVINEDHENPGSTGHIWIQNNNILHARHQGVLVGGTDFHLVGNHVHDNGTNQNESGCLDHGVYFSAHDSVVQGNTFDNNLCFGLQNYNSSGNNTSNNTYFGNVFHTNGSGFVAEQGNGHFIYNNVIYDDATRQDVPGTALCCAPQSRFYYNTVANNHVAGLGPYDTNDSSVDIQNNIFCNNAGGDLNASGASTSNNVTGSCPGFANAGNGDYHITSGHAVPCLSAVTTDFDGNARPSGASCDAGAFEFGGAGPPPADTTPPTVQITGPTSNTTFSTTTTPITLSGNASDNVGVTSVTWSNNRGGSGAASGTTSWSMSVALQGGSNAVTVTAHDAAGNTAQDVLTVTLSSAGDTTAPTITITGPTTATTFSTGTTPLLLSGTASDNVGVTSVTCSNDRGNSCGTSGTTNWTANANLSTGANVLTLTARDAAGNTSTDQITVTLTVTAGNAHHVATNGSNGNSGSSGSPWRDIGYCVSHMSGGETCVVHGGTYTEDNFRLPSGSSGSPTTLMANPGDTVTIHGAGNGDAFLPTSSGTSWLLIDGFHFLGDYVETYVMNNDDYSQDYHHITIQNSELTQTRQSCVLLNGDTYLIQNSHVHHCGATQDHDHNLYFSVHHSVVKNNFIHDSQCFGFQVSNDRAVQMDFDTFDGNTFTNNGCGMGSLIFQGNHTFINNLDYADSLGNSRGVTPGSLVCCEAGTVVFHNTFANNHNVALGSYNGPGDVKPGVEIRNNIFCDNAGGDLQLETESGNTSNNITGSCPGFVNAGNNDYHLTSGHAVPCLSAVTHDHDGNPRPSGSACDAGAYEFGSGIGPDTQNPTIQITSPTTGTTFSTSSTPIALGGTASDNVGVTNVTWSNNTGGSGTASGTLNWSVNIALQTGDNILTVTAHDAAGNAGSDTLTVNLSPSNPPPPPPPPPTSGGLRHVRLCHG